MLYVNSFKLWEHLDLDPASCLRTISTFVQWTRAYFKTSALSDRSLSKQKDFMICSKPVILHMCFGLCLPFVQSFRMT